MSKKTLKKPADMTFEEAVGELDEIVQRIDAGEANLETMMEEHIKFDCIEDHKKD